MRSDPQYPLNVAFIENKTDLKQKTEFSRFRASVCTHHLQLLERVSNLIFGEKNCCLFWNHFRHLCSSASICLSLICFNGNLRAGDGLFSFLFPLSLNRTAGLRSSSNQNKQTQEDIKHSRTNRPSTKTPGDIHCKKQKTVLFPFPGLPVASTESIPNWSLRPSRSKPRAADGGLTGPHVVKHPRILSWRQTSPPSRVAGEQDGQETRSAPLWEFTLIHWLQPLICDENKLFLTSALLSTGRNVSYRDLKRKERAGGADHLDFYLL